MEIFDSIKKHARSPFKGRINRRFYIIAFIALTYLVFLIQGALSHMVDSSSQPISYFFIATMLFVLVIGILVSASLIIKRLHDIGQSARWAILFLLIIWIHPILQIIWIEMSEINQILIFFAEAYLIFTPGKKRDIKKTT